MKCKLFNCHNEAQGTYPCCSQEHGINYKMEKKQIQDAFSVRQNNKYNAFGASGGTEGIRNLYTVEMAQYYNFFIERNIN